MALNERETKRPRRSQTVKPVDEDYDDIQDEQWTVGDHLDQKSFSYSPKKFNEPSFAELVPPEVETEHVVIRCGKFEVEVGSQISEALLNKVLKAVSNA